MVSIKRWGEPFSLGWQTEQLILILSSDARIVFTKRRLMIWRKPMRGPLGHARLYETSRSSKGRALWPFTGFKLNHPEWMTRTLIQPLSDWVWLSCINDIKNVFGNISITVLTQWKSQILRSDWLGKKAFLNITQIVLGLLQWGQGFLLHSLKCFKSA